MADSKLYRSVNTRTHGVQHGSGGDFKHERHTRATQSSDAPRSRMSNKRRQGRDYTPLFRFLLSRVGTPWDTTYAEARARLDSVEPIFQLVARGEAQRRDVVRVGEFTYYSGLFVDEHGLLQKVNPELTSHDMVPRCTCCTQTFNGLPFWNGDPV